MGINFPNSPTEGQTIVIGDNIYVWNGVAWNSKTGTIPPAVTSDTPPTDPVDGQFWWDSNNGILYICYQDVDSTQWVQVNGVPQPDLTPYAKKTAVYPNRFPNPTMDISQENGTNQVQTDLAYPVDQCCLRMSGVTGNAYKTSNVQSPEGTNNYVMFQSGVVKASLAATDLLAIAFPIEANDIEDILYGSYMGKASVLCFTVMGSKIGTYGFSLVLGSNHSYCGTFTISQTYTPKRVIIPIAPYTVGGAYVSPGTGLGATLWIVGSAGASYVGIQGWQASVRYAPPGCDNLCTAISQQLYVTDIALYKDPDQTGLPPPFQHPQFSDMLQRCKRYYNKLTNRWVVAGWAGVASQSIFAQYCYPVPMRTAPTCASTSSGAVNAGTLTLNANGVDSLEARQTAPAIGQSSLIADAITMNARLM